MAETQHLVPLNSGQHLGDLERIIKVARYLLMTGIIKYYYLKYFHDVFQVYGLNKDKFMLQVLYDVL